MLKPHWEATKEELDGWQRTYSIAEDVENNIFLISTRGRSKYGTGTKYVLWKDIEKFDIEPGIAKRHNFKAFSDKEAVQHAQEFIAKKWGIE